MNSKILQRSEIRGKSNGFTVVELLIATAVFSTILLLSTFGIMQVGRTYYKGVTIIRTQNVARNVMDTISQDIQFSGSKPVGTLPAGIGSGSGRFCIGNTRYQYRIGQNVGAGGALRVTENIASGCPNDAAFIQGRELLSQNMRLSRLVIVGNVSEDYSIQLSVAYGDNSLTDPTTGLCFGGSGSQFCATSELNTTITRRIN
jgi:prepilin-type N-terminal cleavage/methylation domain-containing protein